MPSLWPARKQPPECQGCPHEGKAPFVPGVGNLAARHIIIGERPGSCEDGTCTCPAKAHALYEPFVGKSGRRINIGLENDRTDCFITNVRKCQVERETAEEKAASIAHCVRAYLQPELNAIDVAQKAAGVTGAVVQPIGADATRALFGRGNMQKFHATTWTRAERDAMAATADALGGGDGDDGEEPMVGEVE